MRVISNNGADVHVRHGNGTLILRPGYNELPDDLKDHPYVLGLVRSGVLVDAEQAEGRDPQLVLPPQFAAHEIDMRAEPPTEQAFGTAPLEGDVRPFGHIEEEQRNLALRGGMQETRAAEIERNAQPGRSATIGERGGKTPETEAVRDGRTGAQRPAPAGVGNDENGGKAPEPSAADKRAENKAEAKEVPGADQPSDKSRQQHGHHTGKK
jgi:hypothetical protein